MYCIVILLNVQIVFSQVVYKDVKAKIDVEKVEDILSVTGTVENLKSEFKNISFKLAVLKKNKSKSNKSNNAQDGRVTLRTLAKSYLFLKHKLIASKDDQIIICIIYL